MKNNQKRKPLFDALIKYGLKDEVTPFDVPGHKMGKGINEEFINAVGENIFKIDVNSMKELDNLSNPTGVIKEAETLASELFNSDNVFFLVNGSTSGVQNMILAACNPGDKLILPRNIHKSAINGLVISGANPVYIQPLIDKGIGVSMGVSLEDVKKTIDENQDAKAILLLNPTYFGFTMRLREIIDYAHSFSIAVLIDESHGSHFYFNDDFPVDAMELNADLATISVHKTGGSLTQSSMLLHNSGLIRRERVRSVVNLMQTSSASYLLLSSLDMARYNLANNKDLFNNMIEISNYAREKINEIPNLKCITKEVLNGDEVFDMDVSKLLIDVSGLGITGFECYDIMKKDYGIQFEVGETKIVLAIISVGDSIKSINKLIEALSDFSKRYPNPEKLGYSSVNISNPEVLITPREAFFKESEWINLEKSENRIAGDQIMIYPPGIPLVVPGEKITKKIIEDFIFLMRYENQVVGPVVKDNIVKIKVLKEGN